MDGWCIWMNVVPTRRWYPGSFALIKVKWRLKKRARRLTALHYKNTGRLKYRSKQRMICLTWTEIPIHKREPRTTLKVWFYSENGILGSILVCQDPCIRPVQLTGDKIPLLLATPIKLHLHPLASWVLSLLIIFSSKGSRGQILPSVIHMQPHSFQWVSATASD